MYQCCIFDLDGTLLNTLVAISLSANLTLEELGLETIEQERYKFLVGDGASKLVERMLMERGHGEEKELFDRAYPIYQKNFKQYSMYDVRPYDGILELLTSLKEAGIKISVLSNKPHLRTIENIETMFGKGFFDYIQGEREAEGVKRKPDPSGVYQILNYFGLSREECLYIGDTNTDMQTGKNAGLDTVGVTWGFRPESELLEYNPALIAHAPIEILKFAVEKKM